MNNRKLGETVNTLNFRIKELEQSLQYRDKHIESLNNKINKLADLFWYEKKKIKVKEWREIVRDNGGQYYFTGEYKDEEVYEERDAFTDRLIREDEEKQRLIKLAKEIKKGQEIIKNENLHSSFYRKKS